MNKLAEQQNVTVITNFQMEDKLFRVTANVILRDEEGVIAQEVSTVRKGATLEEAEEAAIARATEMLGLGTCEEFTGLSGKKFTLQTQCATVILEKGKRSPATGVQEPDKKAEQVSVDLVVRTEDNKVSRQAVISRVGDDLEATEKLAIARAMAIIGV